jgi:hypothetical protein
MKERKFAFQWAVNSKVEPSPGMDCVPSSRFHCNWTKPFRAIGVFYWLVLNLQIASSIGVYGKWLVGGLFLLLPLGA